MIVSDENLSAASADNKKDALSDWPQGVGRACANVLSRRTAKIAGPSAQRGQSMRAIPVGACRRQRAPTSNRAQFPGRRGGGQPLRKGYGRTLGRTSGEGFPLNRTGTGFVAVHAGG